MFLLVKNKHYTEIKAQIYFLYLTLYMHMSYKHLVSEWNSGTKRPLIAQKKSICLKRKTLQMQC